MREDTWQVDGASAKEKEETREKERQEIQLYR